MMARQRFLLVVALLPVLTADAAAAAAPAPRQLESLKADIDALTKSTFAFWQRHGLDTSFGGFHGSLNRFGKPTEPSTKGLVQMARHVWAFSNFHQSGPNLGGTPTPRQMADSAYKFLTTHMLDKDSRLFVWSVSRDGQYVINDAKVLYGLWFGIYGVAKYAEVFSDPSARQLALSCFRALDARWHNKTTGGYNELVSNNFPQRATSASRKRGRAQADKLLPTSLNAIMHGAEALTQLYSLTKDEQVKNRLLELLRIMCTRMIAPEGLLYGFYTPRPPGKPWKVVQGSIVDFGHNVEASWLISESLDVLLAAGAISRELAGRYRRVLMAVGAKGLQLGYDTKHGGVFEDGLPGEPPKVLSTAKVWWTQAEASVALWCQYLYSNRNPRYLDMLVSTVEFIKKFLNDPEYREWYWQAEADGRQLNKYVPGPGAKGNKWKAYYHNSRMLLLLRQALR